MCPSRRDGMSGFEQPQRFYLAGDRPDTWIDHTIRDGTELVFDRIPGNELPGYLYTVPTGQAFRPVYDPCFANRNRTGVKCCHAPMRSQSYGGAFAARALRFFDRAWGSSGFLWSGQRK
jgi:hypothetical protein